MNDKKDLDNEKDDDVYVIEDMGDVTLEELAREAAEPAKSDATTDVEVTRIREENQKLQDQALRTRADFENFRRRAERDRAEFSKFANAQLMKDILPVLDNLERALTTGGTPTEEFVRGVEMIYKQFSDVLQRAGLRIVDEAPAQFDPNVHEAIVREEGTSFPNHTVIDVLQKGYFLHDRLLRPALVRVAVGEPRPPDESGEAES